MSFEVGWDACILGRVDAALSGGADVLTVVGYAEKSIHALEQRDRILGYVAKLTDEEMSPAALPKMLTCCDFGRIENEGTYTLEDVTGQFQDPTYVCHALPRE